MFNSLLFVFKKIKFFDFLLFIFSYNFDGNIVKTASAKY
jgi:hypothetical protein